MDFELSYLGAAGFGFLSFLSPCVLPMVPFYLSYLAGISMQELTEDNEIAPGAQLRLVLSAILFALGVTTIFVLLGLGATVLGSAFRDFQDHFRWLGSVLLAVFGLHFLGVLRVEFLYRQATIDTTGWKRSNMFSAYLFGLAFGFGWTPCVGPALAAVLMMASSADSLWTGGSILFVYGLGMTLPFVLVALLAKPALRLMKRANWFMPWVERIMGAMLLVFAYLVGTNTISYIAQWMIDTFPSLLELT